MKITIGLVAAVVALGLVIAIALLVWTPAGSAGDPGATPSATVSPSRGPDPQGTPVAGSEVQTPDPSATNPNRLPPRHETGPLIEPPLPPSASAEGALVDGFPAHIMGPTGTSDIVSSSIATEGDTMQVTLVARTDEPQQDVRAHFSSVWNSLGLAESPSNETASLTVEDGSNSLSLAITPSSGTGTVYMVYGVFRTS